MTHYEYLEATANHIPVLAYFAEETAYPPPKRVDGRLEQLKEYIKHRQGVSRFVTPDNLAACVAADLGREAWTIRQKIDPVESEADRGLIQRHLEVLYEIGQKNYDKACALNRAILKEREDSPRTTIIKLVS